MNLLLWIIALIFAIPSNGISLLIVIGINLIQRAIFEQKFNEALKKFEDDELY